jgi:hypothetical protein
MQGLGWSLTLALVRNSQHSKEISRLLAEKVIETTVNSLKVFQKESLLDCLYNSF